MSFRMTATFELVPMLRFGPVGELSATENVRDNGINDGCDEPRVGQELRVPYTAIYVFLK